MMVAAMQLVFFLYMLFSIAVCDDVYKLVNSSVQLDVRTKGYEFHDFFWSFNINSIIVRYNGNSPSRVYSNYKDRVEFNEETHSLTLKNLQKSDSGLYQAKASAEMDKIVAKYQIHVLDPVGKPVLKVSHQKSNDTCNVTLTCEAQNLSITSHCYNNICDMKEEKTAGDVFLSLSLYVSNSFIICNHSNPVSWKNTNMKKEEVKQLCPLEGNIQTGSESNITDKIIVPLTSTFSVIFILIVILIFVICWNKKRATDSVNTVYEEVDPLKKAEQKAQPIEMSENLITPGTVYSTVGKPAQACSNDESTISTATPGNKEMDPSEVNPNDTDLYDTPHENQGAGNNYETVEFTTPHTIYTTVNKAGKLALESQLDGKTFCEK